MPLVWKALIATFATHAWVVLMSNLIPVMAPVVAADIGVDASLVGYYTALVNAGAMIGSIAAGDFVRRYGALRVSQAMMLFGLVGAILLPPASLALIGLSAVLAGLAYGPANPASSHLLAKLTPPSKRGRIFSLKQSSVPVAIATAGICLPLASAEIGWRNVAFLLAVLTLVGMLACQRWRNQLDEDREPTVQIRALGFVDALRLLSKTPPLRRFIFSILPFSGIQFCFTGFFVAFLAERTGMGPTESGPILSLSLAVSVGARFLWGWASDRSSARSTLIVIAVIMGCIALATTQIDERWPWWAITAIGVGFGGTAAAWNGVFLAEVARLAPVDQISTATGAAMFYVSLGAFVIPVLFTLLVEVSGSYAAGYGFVALLCLVPIVGLGARRS